MGGADLPLVRCHSLVVGSGAASLAAADRLHQAGIADILVVTEDIDGGTSRNTGSDKQTYYKLATSTQAADSPYDMAAALYRGGSMHGDLALVEALGSAEAFYHLVSIGVPFPVNRYGGFVGYKTDHDPRQRGTSIGPHTSKVMVERLLAEVRRRGIPILDRHHVVALVTDEPQALAAPKRAVGVLALNEARMEERDFGLTVFLADNIVFGVGGPGGLYETSVYPSAHHGSIGLALEAGVRAVNLTESQYGLASVKFRWNLSGTYQQVLPRYISTAPDGSAEEEFLQAYFDSPGSAASAVFLKGYQWPFDAQKAVGGSSLVDILVYRETVERGRRVFMDFRRNPGTDGSFDFASLSVEARDYLERSGATSGRPIHRLERMNPLAVELYRSNGIDLASEPLEIALCAQHNNGGLEADLHWESVNVDRLFPVGEVNGSHGVYRPGGSALNSGQVGAHRAAAKIAGSYRTPDLDMEAAVRAARGAAGRVLALLGTLCGGASVGHDGSTPASDVVDYRRAFKRRMSRHGAAIRSRSGSRAAAAEALAQVAAFGRLRVASRKDLPAAMAGRQMALAHAAYLSAIAAYLEAGGGSRGSALVLDPMGLPVHAMLGADWKYKPEDETFRDKLQSTVYDGAGFRHDWMPRRPIPAEDFWFESTWREFREGRHLESPEGGDEGGKA